MKIQQPYVVGLVQLRHRLVAKQTAEKLARIQRIHAASLRDGAALVIQAGPDKQKTPGVRSPEVFTTHNSGSGSHGGCSSKCA